MNNEIENKIISIRSTVGASYLKPSGELVTEMVGQLAQNSRAYDYLRYERGLSDETIQYFKLGYDTKRDAISIPMYKDGSLINIKYRFLDPSKHNDTKYQLTRGCETWLYNDIAISLAKNKGRVLIVEGEFDCMAVWQRGFKNVVSPGSGKDSYGVWIELLDTIPEVYIAYDNDEGGKSTAKKMATRVGVEKCKEIIYPTDIKDASEYFKQHTAEDFKKLPAEPFYRYEFVNVVSLLDSMRVHTDTIKIDLIPSVNFGKDWLAILSGKSNVGKTSFTMNIADTLANQGIATLIFPFERGIETVGKRFLQVRYNMSEADFVGVPEDEWKIMKDDALDLPIYFSKPTREGLVDTVKRAKRIFNIGAVVIDHLDYLVRRASNKNDEMAKTIQELKELAMECGVIMFVVHHVKKIGDENSGDPFAGNRRPGLEDLKGSSNLYQDPECVIMLYVEEQDTITVDVLKNKGKMVSKKFAFNPDTGRVLRGGDDGKIKTDVKVATFEQQQLIAQEVFFNDEK